MLSDLRHLAARGASPYTQEVRTSPSPAAGAEFTITVPSGQVWDVISIHALFTTSAAVANRVPSLIIDDQTSQVGRFPVHANIAASLATDITWIPGGSINDTSILGSALLAVTPRALLLPGWRLRSSTALIDAADTYTGLTVWINRYDTPPGTLNQQYGIPIEDILQLVQENAARES